MSSTSETSALSPPDALIVAGGESIGDSRLAVPLARLGWSLPGLRSVPLIAADSGADLALDLGLLPTVVVGDMDSISPDALSRLRELGVPLIRHPPDKDRTDLELALDETASLLATPRPEGIGGTASSHTVLVLGAGGGRLDHLLGNIAVLTASRYQGLGAVIVTADTIMIPVGPGTGKRSIPAMAGDTVTLLAVGGPASGVTTRGLRYPLHGALLAADSSLGLSNVVEPTEPAESPPSVAVAGGTVLVIVPLPETIHPPRSPAEAP